MNYFTAHINVTTRKRDLKYKAVPVYALKEWGSGGKAPHILTSRIDKGAWLASAENIH